MRHCTISCLAKARHSPDGYCAPVDKKVGFVIAILVGALLAAVLGSSLFENEKSVARPAVVPVAPSVVAPAPVVRAPAAAPIVRAAPPSERTTEPREVTTRGPNGETIVVTSDGTVISTTVTRPPDGAN